MRYLKLTKLERRIRNRSERAEGSQNRNETLTQQARRLALVTFALRCALVKNHAHVAQQCDRCQAAKSKQTRRKQIMHPFSELSF